MCAMLASVSFRVASLLHVLDCYAEYLGMSFFWSQQEDKKTSERNRRCSDKKKAHKHLARKLVETAVNPGTINR